MIFPCMELYLAIFQVFHDFQSLWEPWGLYEHSIVANRKLASTNKPVTFRSVHTGIEPPFLLKLYYAITDSGLYIQKILTKREMINCQKFNFLLFLTINSVTTAVRELNGTSQISLVTHDAKGEMQVI